MLNSRNCLLDEETADDYELIDYGPGYLIAAGTKEAARLIGAHLAAGLRTSATVIVGPSSSAKFPEGAAAQLQIGDVLYSPIVDCVGTIIALLDTTNGDHVQPDALAAA